MSLSSKNSELEKQIANVKLEYSMNFLSSSVNCFNIYFISSIALSVLAFVIVNEDKMCYCELKIKSVGSFGTILLLL